MIQQLLGQKRKFCDLASVGFLRDLQRVFTPRNCDFTPECETAGLGCVFTAERGDTADPTISWDHRPTKVAKGAVWAGQLQLDARADGDAKADACMGARALVPRSTAHQLTVSSPPSASPAPSSPTPSFFFATAPSPPPLPRCLWSPPGRRLRLDAATTVGCGPTAVQSPDAPNIPTCTANAHREIHDRAQAVRGVPRERGAS